jgi:hypothetical protein
LRDGLSKNNKCFIYWRTNWGMKNQENTNQFMDNKKCLKVEDTMETRKRIRDWNKQK